MNKRALVAKIVKTPVHMLDMINYSSRYAKELEDNDKVAPLFPNRMKLHEFVATQCDAQPIDYLEFGVWKGETFKKWLAMNTNAQSRFFGFDSFEGLPEDWEKDLPKGTFSVDGQTPEIQDQRGEFVVGWFDNTLYPFLERYPLNRQLVVHIDCDLYSSTLFVLAALDRHLPPRTILIFDDYSSLTHEFAAWLDYRRSFGRSWAPLGRTESGGQASVRLIG